MKEPVQYLLSNYVAWGAIGAAIGIAAVVFWINRSAGKIMGIILGGLFIAVCAMFPEMMLAKAGEFMRAVLNMWNPGG